MSRQNTIEDFWEKVDKHGPYPKKKACKIHPEIAGTRCWVWIAGCNGNYGIFRFKGIVVKVYRFAYELKYGKGSLGKKYALHKCDNPKCVRWSHLFKGTYADNNKDRDLKGRHKTHYSKGSANGYARLAEKDVRLIKQLRSDGWYNKDIAKKFNVHTGTIQAITVGRSWKHVCK